MVVRNYLVQEVWVSMRSSTVFSRVPGTIRYSDQNLRLSESKRYHKTITQDMYYSLHLPSLPTHDRVTHITGTVSVSTESFLSNVVLGVDSMRWSIRNSKVCGKVSNQYLSNRQI